MFSLNIHQHYYLYRYPTDMRKSFNGLSGLVRNELEVNPMSGGVFIFINRRRDRIKLLVWERGGFVLYYKLLEAGCFELPVFENNGKQKDLTWLELVLILEGFSLKSVSRRKRYN